MLKSMRYRNRGGDLSVQSSSLKKNYAKYQIFLSPFGNKNLYTKMSKL